MDSPAAVPSIMWCLSRVRAAFAGGVMPENIWRRVVSGGAMWRTPHAKMLASLNRSNFCVSPVAAQSPLTAGSALTTDPTHEYYGSLPLLNDAQRMATRVRTMRPLWWLAKPHFLVIAALMLLPACTAEPTGPEIPSMSGTVRDTFRMHQSLAPLSRFKENLRSAIPTAVIRSIGFRSAPH